MPVWNKFLFVATLVLASSAFGQDEAMEVSKIFRANSVVAVRVPADHGIKKFQRICFFEGESRVGCGKAIVVKDKYILVRWRLGDINELTMDVVPKIQKTRRKSTVEDQEEEQEETETSDPWEFSKALTYETRIRHYFKDKTETGTEVRQDQSSVKLNPKFSLGQGFGRKKLSAEFFMRSSLSHEERPDIDVRELMYTQRHESITVGLGIGKVFWGVLETTNIVDVINQIDFKESFDGKERLGQPLVWVSWQKDGLTYDAYALPGSRERTFGKSGTPFGPPLPLSRSTEFEGKDGRKQIDTAHRVALSHDDLEVSANWFRGYDRDPVIVSTGGFLGPVLTPYYQTMSQFGATAQYSIDELILKSETRVRLVEPRNYSMFGAGIEYNFYGVLDSAVDVGMILEGYYDDRTDESTEYNQNDLIIGGRLLFNDPYTTELTIGFGKDLAYGSSAMSIDLSSGIQGSYLGTFRVRRVMGSGEDDLISKALEHASYLELEFGLYY